MGVAQADTAAEPSPLERQLLLGLVAFRWAAWVWFAVVLVVTRNDLDQPGVAIGLAGAALAVTIAATVLARREPGRLLRRPAVAVETAAAAALPAADGVAYRIDSSQTLGSAWPLSAVLAAGVAFGPVGGALSGGVVGVARIAGATTAESFLSRFSSAVLFVLAGTVAGALAQRLRTAERTISAARAREEVARTLHDGVLQTLAIVQRQASDARLVRLAHEQERDLRDFLFGRSGPSAGGELGPALRAAAARHEDRYGGRVQVVLADDVPVLADATVEAVAGAVTEALTNAGKHGQAQRLTIYVEPTDGGGAFCSVKDDGAGFDHRTTAEGVGITHSLRARIGDVGGWVEIDGNPGTGAEVRLWVP